MPLLPWLEEPTLNNDLHRDIDVVQFFSTGAALFKFESTSILLDG